MARLRFRCGAPLVITDKRKTHDHCRRPVAYEGGRCYHHREKFPQTVGATERSRDVHE